MEVIPDTLTRKGKRSVRRHLFLTSVRTTPEVPGVNYIGAPT